MGNVRVNSLLQKTKDARESVHALEKLVSACESDGDLMQKINDILFAGKSSWCASDKSAKELLCTAMVGLYDYVAVLDSVLDNITVEWPPASGTP